MLFHLVAYRPIDPAENGLNFSQPAALQRLEPYQEADHAQPFVKFLTLQQSEQSSAGSTAPSTAADFYALGVDSQKTGQIEAAIQAYQQAIDLDATFDAAYINLGLAYIQLGQFDNASQTFQQVLILPDRPERPASIHTLAHYNLAIILNRQGKPDEAVMEVQRALEITPDFSRAQQLLQQIQPR